MNRMCRGFAILACTAAFVLPGCSSHNMPSTFVSPNEAAQSVLRASPYVRLMAETSAVNTIGGFTLASAEFRNGTTLPPNAAGIAPPQCHGENRSTSLDWSNAPSGTKSFAIVLFDETADFAHWGIYNVAPELNRLPAGVRPGNTASWTQTVDDAGVQGYFGPCPPPGIAHRYVFTIYALDTTLSVNNASPSLPVESLLNAMMGHVLGRASITGFFQKS